VNIQWTLSEHSVNILWTFCEHSVNILWTFCEHSVNILWTFCEHSVNIAWGHPICVMCCYDYCCWCNDDFEVHIINANNNIKYANTQQRRVLQGVFCLRYALMQMNIQGAFREQTGNLQGTFRNHLRNIQKTPRKVCNFFAHSMTVSFMIVILPQAITGSMKVLELKPGLWAVIHDRNSKIKWNKWRIRVFWSRRWFAIWRRPTPLLFRLGSSLFRHVPAPTNPKVHAKHVDFSPCGRV
jgi:hypothetical protein